MKKKLFVISFIFIIVLTLSLGKKNEPKMTDLLLANVEALALTETNPVSFCNTYCKSKIGFYCVLETNYGFSICCHDMIPNYSN